MNAQKSFDEALYSVLELRPGAKAQVVALKNNPSTFSKGVYLEHYLDFLKLLAFAAPLDQQTFPLLTSSRIQQLSKSNFNHQNDGLICQMYLHLAMSHVLVGEYVKSAKAVWQGYQSFEEISKGGMTDPFEVIKLKSIFNILIGVVPDDQKWVTSMLRLKGDVDLGFGELSKYRQAVSNEKGISLEANLIEGVMHLYFDDHLKQFDCSRLKTSNALCGYINGVISIKTRKRVHCLLVTSNDRNEFPLLNYVEGRILLNNLNDSCISRFDRFEKLYKGTSFKADILLRRAWWAVLNNKAEEVDRCQKQILQLSDLPISADKQAIKEVAYISANPLVLIRSRLLFDGGHLNEAMKELTQISDKELFACEYYYRQGRIWHDMGQLQKALDSYRLCISNNTQPARYFAANAALQMAYIELDACHFELVRKYLDECNRLNIDEYKSDIKNNAAKMRQVLTSLESQSTK